VGTSRFSRPRAPERLLEVAGDLFYEEGINAVGVDRIAAEADASKTTLYAHYGNKDGLVAAYLDRRAALSREQLAEQVQDAGDAREKLLEVFSAHSPTGTARMTSTAATSSTPAANWPTPTIPLSRWAAATATG